MGVPGGRVSARGKYCCVSVPGFAHVGSLGSGAWVVTSPGFGLMEAYGLPPLAGSFGWDWDIPADKGNLGTGTAMGSVRPATSSITAPISGTRRNFSGVCPRLMNPGEGSSIVAPAAAAPEVVFVWFDNSIIFGRRVVVAAPAAAGRAAAASCWHTYRSAHALACSASGWQCMASACRCRSRSHAVAKTQVCTDDTCIEA